MSLISIRNFVAPLTNTTNLVTIILITVLFALFRLQGGGFTIRNNERLPAQQRSGTDSTSAAESSAGAGEDIESLGILAPRRSTSEQRVPALPEEGTIQITEEEERDLLDQMIGQQGGRQGGTDQVRAPAADRNRERSGNSLEEIERSLGIR